MNGKLLWPRVDHIAAEVQRHRAILHAVELGYTSIVVREEDRELTSSVRFDAVTVTRDAVFINGKRRGSVLHLKGPEDMPAAALNSEFLIVRSDDWKIIPLENLLAMHQGKGCSIIAEAETREEAELFMGTLERGVDGVIFPYEKIQGFASMLVSTPQLQLQEAEVKSVQHAGMGDRVCVDTCSLFHQHEGLLVGSQASSLFLVHAENLRARYVNPRPFRVNAGPVHSYVLLPDGTTKYLSELKGGARVLGVSADGSTRVMTVGRIKIERRPLVLVEAICEERECSLLLQNAETVNLCTKGEPVPVTRLSPGDRVLVHIEEGARHFGMRIKEDIREL